MPVSPSQRFTGRTAAVCSGGRRIDEATVRRLAIEDADVVVFARIATEILASDDASAITGSELAVDGGTTANRCLVETLPAW